MSHSPVRVGITQGDINSISYEVILRALEDDRMLELCTPIVYGSAKIASFYRKELGIDAARFNQIPSAAEAKAGANNIINVVGEDVPIEPGKPTRAAGAAALAAIEAAVADLKAGLIDVLVTGPINKHTIQCDTFAFPGHTEYLESALGDEGDEALMVLCAGTMRVALVTTHMPLRDVPAAITREAVAAKLRALHTSLRRDFAIPSPRIAVLSLNPHSGEQGLLGTEEQEIIEPVIAEAMKEKILAFGPYAADGLFGSGGFDRFDGILAMYHDQGLAPFKALAMESGVNFTAGLPYVRTSPDHGTGYDIAGQGKADPESMRHAIFTAIDIFRNRKKESHI